MPRLVVKNFGPIKEVDLDLPEFLILAGRQASGKSTLARIIDFFFRFNQDVYETLLILPEKSKEEIWQRVIKARYRRFTSYFPQLAFKDFEIVFYLDSKTSMGVRHNSDSTLDFLLDETIQNSIHDVIDFAFKTKNVEKNSKIFKNTMYFFSNALLEEVSAAFPSYGDPVFIPDARSSGPRDEYIKRISLHDEFFNLINRLKESDVWTQYSERVDIEIAALSDALIRDILKADYRFSDSEDRLYFESDQFVNLGNSSSGQKEAVWAVNILRYLIHQATPIVLTFEEPEAHLYPEGQRLMARLIALQFNCAKNRTVVTTHSPYLMESLNNLIFAHRVGQSKPEEVGKRFSKHLWLPLDKVGAYIIENGRLVNAIDDELGEVITAKIDDASSFNLADYDYLFDLEGD